jgi:hypothetical protein
VKSCSWPQARQGQTFDDGAGILVAGFAAGGKVKNKQFIEGSKFAQTKVFCKLHNV